MPKLTDTQLVILSAAAGREDHAVLPLIDTLNANKAALTRSINSLLKRDLIIEKPVKTSAPSWREEEDHKIGLYIADAGLKALGIETGGDGAETAAQSSDSARRARSRPKTRTGAKGDGPDRTTKADHVLDMLRQPNGVALSEIQDATKWQPHTVRAFISGLRKKGTEIGRTRNDAGECVYSITGA
jgi:DNA-binding MarR family transcriptional regulator